MLKSASDLFQRHALFFSENEALQDNVDETWLQDYLKPVSIEDMEESDSTICYYVGGYIGRSISRRRKCLSCKELLIQSHEITPQDVEMSPEYKALFELADRGGLSAPSEYCFATTAIAVQFYTTIDMDDNIMHRLLMCFNQRNTFVNAVTKSVLSSEILHSLFHIQCSARHTNFQLILQSVFNCCAKNQLKQINSRPNLPDPPSKAMRYIKKLTGKSSSDHDIIAL